MTNDPRHSWVFIGVIAIVALSFVGIGVFGYLGERRGRMSRSWPSTKGVSVSTRVVREWASRNFPYSLYGGECSVKYTVDGKVYFLWVGSGSVDPSPRVMAERMQECPTPHYVYTTTREIQQTPLLSDLKRRNNESEKHTRKPR